MPSENEKIKLDVSEEKIVYQNANNNCSVEVFLNGYLIKTTYMMQSNETKFRERIVVGGRDKIEEVEICLRMIRGKEKREIEIRGFIRELIIGAWEDSE